MSLSSNAPDIASGPVRLFPSTNGVPSAVMIIALYSKGRFEKDARSLGEGDVFAIDRYTSKHKAHGGELPDIALKIRAAHEWRMEESLCKQGPVLIWQKAVAADRVGSSNAEDPGNAKDSAYKEYASRSKDSQTPEWWDYTGTRSDVDSHGKTEARRTGLQQR